MSDEWVMVPRDLLQRVDAALQRHLDRHAPMRIPVDQTDSDLVQSDVQALIAAPAAPQQAEPVAQIGWADEFGNLFPMGAWKPTQRTHHDSHKTAWRAVYLHPPAAEVQQAEPVGDFQRSAPGKIWMNLGNDGMDEIEYPTWDALVRADENITWSEDRIDATDIPYVRADLAHPPAAEVQRGSGVGAPMSAHPDETAVDEFASMMKAKLSAARKRGKSGWNDPGWHPDDISAALREHVDKGDPVDVANYAMFLALREEGIAPHPPAAEEPLQGGLDNEELLEAWRTKVPGVEPTDCDLRAFALGVEFGTRGKRVYFDERNSARDAWRRRVKQCETLEAEVQRLRDAALAVVDAYRNIGPVTVAIDALRRVLEGGE